MDLTNEELRIVSALAEKQVAVETKMKLLQNQLADCEVELKQVREIDLPAAMQEVGMDSFTLSNGRKISLKTDVYCSIPKDDGGRAFSWLREHDFGSLIKNVISVDFGKGEDDKAIEAAQLLAGGGFNPQQKESVHAMTLKAFINEQMKKGASIPLDYFGAFIVTKSKVE